MHGTDIVDRGIIVLYFGLFLLFFSLFFPLPPSPGNFSADELDGVVIPGMIVVWMQNLCIFDLDTHLLVKIPRQETAKGPFLSSS